MSWLFYQGMSAIFSPELEIGGGSFEKIYLTRGPRGRERGRESQLRKYWVKYKSLWNLHIEREIVLLFP